MASFSFEAEKLSFRAKWMTKSIFWFLLVLVKIPKMVILYKVTKIQKLY